MGDVVAFRRARLSGFLPDDLGPVVKPYDPRAPLQLDRKAFLDMARKGSPPVNDDNPPDCA
jgi:hypothetical protein